MVVLTPRLQAVADYVQKGSVIADIGTDHAYVPAYLLQSGVIQRAFACDINEGPLENARATIEQYRLAGVSFYLSDGLQALEGEAFDTVIVAGMGGEMIRAILEQSPWCRDKKYRFILQPMTKAELLRRYLCESGFAITAETFAREKEKLYSVMCAAYCGSAQQISQVQALLGTALSHKLFEEKRQRELARLGRIYTSLQSKADSGEQQQEILKLIKEIEEYKC